MKWLVVASFFVCVATLCKGNESTQSASNLRERRKNNPAECRAGTEWESNCHTCRCSEDGHAECTRMDTCRTGDYGDPIRCKPQTSYKKECNTCTCLDNGLSVCTMIGCLPSYILPPSTPTPLPEKEMSKHCLPGSRWKSKCNQCFCSQSGLPTCTEMACVGQESEIEMECAPGTFWYNDCNQCWCNKGVATCTRMECTQYILTNFPSPIQSPSDESTDLDHNLSSHGHYTKKRSTLCKSNSSFKNDCNFCKCSSDGQSFSCTTHECMEGDINDDVEVFMESEGADHVERHSVCKPRGIFNIGCNTCLCSADGLDFTCTNKPCPLPKDVEIFDELRASLRSSIIEKEVVCAANRMFVKDCNTCWCNEDGTSYFCTRKVCITELPEDLNEEKPENLQEVKRKCRPDEVFELDCNMCRCNSDGLSFSCTRRACMPEEKGKNVSLNRRIRATAQGTPKNCQPGQEFRMDCNKCLCDNEGQNYSCTRIDCAALNSNGNGGARRKREATTQVTETKCVPESVFNQDCNVCRCAADGEHATCTLKRCKENKPDESEDNQNSEDSDLSFRCNPGEQFKRGCNDCTCSADGKSVFCTLRLCDQDITPAI